MFSTRNILLVIVLIAIVGSIVYLQSQKASPVQSKAKNASDEIRIEDLPSKSASGTTEMTEGEMASSSESTTTTEMTKGDALEDTAVASSETKSSESMALTKTREEIIAEKAKKYPRAKEISTPDGFINTDPFKIADLIGKKVILIDFWTYSCINCQRTLPYLNSWYQKYEKDGLVIIGIHTPEFEFEKNYDNVKQAVEKFGVKYPVVLDNDYSTWNAYENRYWPREYLIDIDGFIVHDHIGEGGYDETEQEIVKLLNERSEVLNMGMNVTLDTTAPQGVDQTDFSKIQTVESYFGSSRMQFLMNLPSEDCLSKSCDFTAPTEVTANQFALSGTWKLEPEYAVLEGNGGSILSNFTAGKANLVAGSDMPVEGEVYLDGKSIGADVAGADVKDGKVTIEAHQLYNLVDLHGDYGTHTLEVRFKDGGVSAYTLTFG